MAFWERLEKLNINKKYESIWQVKYPADTKDIWASRNITVMIHLAVTDHR